VVNHLPEAAELRLTLGCDDDEVRVRTHEAIGSDVNAMAGGIFQNEIEEEALGGIELEDVREVVAAPGAVVGGAKIDEKSARDARHVPADRQVVCRTL
jgi:hypothetical protein